MSDDLIRLAEIVEVLHAKWMPHEGQIPIGSALFYQGIKNVFCQAGRNFGKTDVASYCTTRWAMQYPGTENYIFEPYLNQAREILWASNRIQDFVPEQWIDSINNTEMRIRLVNKSFIKLDGADNEDARRGIKPGGLIVYDEFKDHKPSFTKAMEPNRVAKKVPALFIGTPPAVHNQYVDFSEYAKKSSSWAYFHAPTSTNPFIDKEILRQERERLTAMGDEEEYLREYEALFIKGGKNHLLPQFLALKHLPFDELIESAAA